MDRTPIKFGTDGWRAIIADAYTFENVRRVAQATADYFLEADLASRGVVVGYDTRFASEHFAAAVAEVMAGNGIPVALCQTPTPTPTTSYSILVRKAGGAVVITASHNPPLYNGFKVKPEYAGSASPEVVAAIEANLDRRPVQRMPLQEALDRGLVERFDPRPAYFEQIARLVDLEALKEAGLTVVVDAMYGAGQGYFPELLDGGSTRVIQLNGERNPYFGGVNPEPIARNLKKLMKVVRESGSDVGIALDGDADRVGLVDEQGNFVDQLRVFGLLTLYLLEVRGWRGPIVKSLSTTSMVELLGEQYGVPVYETPVGFKYIGPKMIEVEAMIGGEESGGYGFRGHIPERDGILAGLFLLDMMVKLKRTPSQLVELLFEKVGPHYYDRLDLSFPAERRAEIQQRLQEATPKELDGIPVVRIQREGGFKFLREDGSWLLIRFSGTEPILRIYTETKDPEAVERMLQEGRRLADV